MDTEIALALTRVRESTDRLQATADALTDAQAAAPSRLPGWTRGHVLTHLARNADGFANLLTWARTGTETPMYPSEEARARGIEEGAGRSAAELAADLRISAAAFAGAAEDLPAEAWDSLVTRRGSTFPAWGILDRRLSEVEIHHVDLGAGYQAADWPADFVLAQLARVAGDFVGRPDAPACVARPDGLGAFPIGPAGPVLASTGPLSSGAASTGPLSSGAASTGPLSSGAASTGPAGRVTVSGPPAVLLAWLIGRDSGAGLEVEGADAVPVLPSWR